MGRVAVIDDSKDTLEIFEIVLREESHDFVFYENPLNFLREFEPGTFALVLVDLAMPQLNGYETFRQIRKQDKNVPVCAVTAIASPDEREKALQEGFCDYFVKPILEIEKFRQSVYSHIGGCANPPHSPQKPAA